MPTVSTAAVDNTFRPFPLQIQNLCYPAPISRATLPQRAKIPHFPQRYYYYYIYNRKETIRRFLDIFQPRKLTKVA